LDVFLAKFVLPVCFQNAKAESKNAPVVPKECAAAMPTYAMECAHSVVTKLRNANRRTKERVRRQSNELLSLESI
jgi:hypothetical protein